VGDEHLEPPPRGTGAGRSWRERPDWWPDPPDASELEEQEEAARAPEASPARKATARRPTDAPPRRGAEDRTRQDPPTLPELPNQWAQLPPTVPSVPTPPHGIRRSTILLILLWLAILALYLWVRPVG
jgi:hypothetical protein